MADLNNCQFSTETVDNDETYRNLAYDNKAPFWYCSTDYITLTGCYGLVDNIYPRIGIKWEDPWSSDDYAEFVVMMIRPD